MSIGIYAPVLSTGTGFLWDDDSELWGTRGHLVQRDDGPLIAWFPIQKPASGWLDVGAWEPIRGHGFWPLTPTVLWAEWRIFGADALWKNEPDPKRRPAAIEGLAPLFHWPGVLLHGLNGLLIVALMRRMHIRGAFWIGALFVAHPLAVASVAWVSELKNTLSLFWLLIAAWCFVRAVEPTEGSATGPRMLRLGAFVAFFLSLAAKTAGVGLPIVLGAYVWWREGKISKARCGQLAPLFVISLAMGLTTLWFVSESGGMTAEVDAPANFWLRLAGAGWVPWFYLGKTLWPAGLMMIYPQFALVPNAISTWLPGLAWMAVATGAIVLRSQGGRGLLFALIAYFALMFPVLGFIDMTFMMHAPVSDHLHYLSIVPALALIVSSSIRFIGQSPGGRRTLGAVFALACMICAWAAHQHAEIYKTQHRLWAHNVAANPEAWMAQYNLGHLLELDARKEPNGEVQRGIYARALGHLETAARLKPVYVNAADREGHVHAALGDDGAAIEAWRRAIAASGSAAQPQAERIGLSEREIARAYVRLGDLETASVFFERALIHVPAAWKTRIEWARALSAQGRERAALSQYRYILERKPGAANARIDLSLQLSESDNAQIRDGAEALRQARLAMDATEPGSQLRFRALVALAASHAEMASVEEGDGSEGWDAATLTIGRAHRLAIRLADEDARAGAERRLQLYRARRRSPLN